MTQLCKMTSLDDINSFRYDDVADTELCESGLLGN
jgi:hypothetical protein